MTKFVIYRRLSKEDKSKTQHGFDSQMRDINFYLSSLDSYEVVGDFQEFISGGEDNKPELTKAMQLCERCGATLLVAKLDRLSRRVSQIAGYMEGKVRFKVASIPNADNFQLHLYSALAEQERATIRMRVKQGLAAAKDKGVKLGAASDKYQRNPNNATKRNMKEATTRTQHLVEKIKLVSSGMAKPTFKSVAECLTKNNTPLPSGKEGVWSASQVKRVCDRFEVSIY